MDSAHRELGPFPRTHSLSVTDVIDAEAQLETVLFMHVYAYSMDVRSIAFLAQS